MRLALVYLFDPEIARACVRFAATIAAGRAAVACLGEHALPHLTLLHADTHEAPERIWQDARDRLPAEATVEFLALGALRQHDSPAGGGMAWLVVPCTPTLRAAEQHALGLPSLQNAEIVTCNGDRFQPHVTLALWDGDTTPAALELPADLVPRRGVVGRLALGAIGPYGTYLRTFHQA